MRDKNIKFPKMNLKVMHSSLHKIITQLSPKTQTRFQMKKSNYFYDERLDKLIHI